MSGQVVKKSYLGDSVYVDIEDGMFKLTTENGLGPTNTIYLEPEVYEAFVMYADAALGKSSGEVK